MISAQNSDDEDTIIKLQTEQSLSRRVEELLLPFVGKTVVVIDLKLSYPSFSLADFQSSIINDDQLSSRKKADIVSANIEKLETNRIKILSKNVTVYLSDTIDRQMEDFVRTSVIKWLKLDTSKEDKLSLSKTLGVKEITSAISGKQIGFAKTENTASDEFTPVKIEGFDINIYIVMVSALLMLLLIILLFMNSSFKTGLKGLSASIGSLNVGRIGSADLSAKLVQSKAPTILEDSKKNPLQISVLEQERTEEFTPDFSFLENLKISSLGEILKKESSQDAAFVLSTLSPDFAKDFFDEFTGDTEEIINTLLSNFDISKEYVEILQNKLFKEYKKSLAIEPLKTDGKDTLIRFVNYLPSERSKKLYEKIEEINFEKSKDLRKRILMFDDLSELNDDEIMSIIDNLDHDSLVLFLKSVKYEIRERFFSKMSERIASMFREDMELHRALSDEEKEETINDFLNSIREILHYK